LAKYSKARANGSGVAHKKAGVGQVGAGVLSAPPEPFARAFEYFAKNLK